MYICMCQRFVLFFKKEKKNKLSQKSKRSKKIFFFHSLPLTTLFKNSTFVDNDNELITRPNVS